MEVDDDINGPVVRNTGGSHCRPTVAPPGYPIWPAETEIIDVPGQRLGLSAQSPLLKLILKIAFEKLKIALVFDNAFPSAQDMPRFLRACVTDAARDHTNRDGRYNASADCVLQRIISSVDYESKIIRLVSHFIPILPD